MTEAASGWSNEDDNEYDMNEKKNIDENDFLERIVIHHLSSDEQLVEQLKKLLLQVLSITKEF